MDHESDPDKLGSPRARLLPHAHDQAALQRRAMELDAGVAAAVVFLATVLARSPGGFAEATKTIALARESLRAVDVALSYPPAGADTMAVLDALYATLDRLVHRLS